MAQVEGYATGSSGLNKPAQSVQTLGALGSVSSTRSAVLPAFQTFQDAARKVVESVATAVMTFPDDADAALPAVAASASERFADVGAKIEKYVAAADQVRIHLDRQSLHQMNASLLGLAAPDAHTVDEPAAAQKLKVEARDFQACQEHIRDFCAYLTSH